MLSAELPSAVRCNDQRASAQSFLSSRTKFIKFEVDEELSFTVIMNPNMGRRSSPYVCGDPLPFCVNCRQPFTRKYKGWNRFRVTRITSENTWTTLFGKPALYKPSSFICRTCYKFLVSNTRPAMSITHYGRSLMRILKGAKPNPANDGADVSEEKTDNDTLTLATPLAEPETDVPEEIIEDDVEEMIEDDVEEIIEDDTSATPPANTDVREERTKGDTPPAESAIKLRELHYSKDVSMVGPPPKNWQWVLVPVLRPCDPNKATPPQRSVEGHSSTKGQKKKSQIQGPVLHAPVSDGDKAPQETTKGNSSSTSSAKEKNRYLILGPYHQVSDEDRAPQEKTTDDSSTTPSTEQQKGLPTQGPLPPATVAGGEKAPQEKNKGASSSPAATAQNKKYLLVGPLPRGPDQDEDRAPQEKTTDDSSTTPSTEQQKGLPTQGPLPPATIAGADKAPQEKNKGASSSTAATAQNQQYLHVGSLPRGPDQGSDRARQKKGVLFAVSSRDILKLSDSPNLLPQAPVSGGDKLPQTTSKRKSTYSTILSSKRRKQSVLTHRTLPRAPDTDGGKAPSTLPLAKRWTSQMKQNSASNTDGDKAPQENTESDSTTTPSARRRKQVLTPDDGKNAPESRGLTTPSHLLQNGEDANLERSIPFSSSLPNEHSEDDEVDDRPPPRRKTMKDLAIEYIIASKYRLAFKKLYEESQQARKAFLAFAQEMIRKELMSEKP
ncbi:uncharacterized protein [Diadema setosum]|uniref:uncharacterized protein n=1 Tax=Diadema setosum TaxID=31175 RepID=UPI003B3B6506